MGGRSRSPVRCLSVGHSVQFFHEADPDDVEAWYVLPQEATSSSPLLLQSHGWLDGTLQEEFCPRSYCPEQPVSWPLVVPRHDISFTDRSGRRCPRESARARRVQVHLVRELAARLPLLSVLLVRRAGSLPITREGQFGSTPSDMYMSALIRLGIMPHPQLAGHDFELFSLFVNDSEDLERVVDMAPQIASTLRGRHKASFWMLWPVEWEDCGCTEMGYVVRESFFRAMRSCQASGICSAFPHPAELYELIASKSWKVSLSLDPLAMLPAAVVVSRSSVESDPVSAARKAVFGLEQIRRQNPFPVLPGEPAAPSSVNEFGVKRGVVKLGWSWEAKDVMVFNSEEELGWRMAEVLLESSGCTASECIVQEWVDFDFELRCYFVPPRGWVSSHFLKPERIEWNAWGEPCAQGRPRGFELLTEEMCLSRWGQDEGAMLSAKEQAVEISQHLLAWLLPTGSRPVPMIRLDFMTRRVSSGKARVVFGEFCEMGAAMLGWKEGTVTMWRAALDSALR
ncbi:unnamed protein product [Polarella glacialis]|uniref:Uncharacterized protein n=1 Tax=Polarella glacialis TaxID=89957 RepID=A0A813DP88_POLGL|nr:unnamed protein product [Polarella glacialis]